MRTNTGRGAGIKLLPTKRGVLLSTFLLELRDVLPLLSLKLL